MIHLVGPFVLVAILAACGTYGILARRNAVLMLVGVELVLASASLLLVTMSSVLPDRDSAGQILTLFVITLAAAEVALALGIVLAAFRSRGHVDLTEPLDEAVDGSRPGSEPGSRLVSGSSRAPVDAMTSQRDPRVAVARDDAARPEESGGASTS